MGRPAKGYKNEAGKRIVGVTTVGGVFGDKGAIIRAANYLGLDGKTVQDEWYTKASNIGTLGHDLFEQYLTTGILIGYKGIDLLLCTEEEIAKANIDLLPYTDEEIFKANIAKNAAIQWFEGSRIEIVWTEQPLVSEKMQCGGTPDALGKDHNGNHVILDWKTGGVYGSALFQVAAYKIIVEENYDIEIKGFHIVRFAKDTGDFVHRYYPELDEQVEAFPQMVKLYRLLQRTEKRAK